MAGRLAVAPQAEQFVLPRPLRRAVRFVIGLCTGRITIAPALGRLSFAAYCAFVVGYGVIAGGHGQTVAQSLTSAAGFAIEDVRVSGNQHTSEIDILQLLGLDGTTSLLALDIGAARQALSVLPWVETAEVRKVYPRTVEVMLKERQAFGIWQHGSELSIIEKNGSVIAPLRDNKFASLPLFVGRDAERAASSIETEFASWPAITPQIKAYVRVASRRWDVHLDNGVIIKLPETGMAEAMDRLGRLEAEQQVLERDIAAIDLRLPDRIAIRLTPEAQERREQALAEREKFLKKQGQRT
ncbi:cell division protein FtsQ/DivIB [Ciceribacter sp. L1K23]|uniref:cell division protein FtsQ/DivIB n=1 Tax=unclassified Ciceribacter TaxID=2628820 RepID=UPI001ABEA339|nr:MULTISPECIES: cell division protein FtsQ/DivIB [unclassified Ciceribacter]MBO3760850.1 cell division protein FtsQ/DivIB [Ciceribacter sp. L1K22]MBR0555091.1 cell division protein FtsQ/DivIB [Ciceribacter sp. L1K23]